MTTAARKRFRGVLQTYYLAHGRHDLPWRQLGPDGTIDPYLVLVSELMLQQTQVSRVIPKFHEFITKLPTITALAKASLGEVLSIWSGLGYNRRAKFLWQAARHIAQDYPDSFPQTAEELVALPGVGTNTAGAIMAYAFNQPALFVETNIRTVYIHHFFQDETNIPDTSILSLVAETLDQAQPRTFYWSLMDYGTYLKQTLGNLSKASKHYTRQSTFQGSRRQVRGLVIRSLTNGKQTADRLADIIADERLTSVLDDLLREGMITKSNGKYQLH